MGRCLVYSATRAMAAPHGRRDRPIDLEPLARWCGRVLERGLERGLDRASPAATTIPPLPRELRKPLRANGFDAFDETVVALALAPDLDPVLAVAVSALLGTTALRYPTVSIIADLVGADGADRVTVAARLSPGGPLSKTGLLHIVPPAESPVAGDPPRGPTMLAGVVASTALLRWTFGVTRLDPELFPLVRDDLIAPETPPDPEAAAALIARLSDHDLSLTSLIGERSTDALNTALFAAARRGRPALVADAQALTPSPATSRVTAEALLRDAVVICTGDLAMVPPGHWKRSRPSSRSARTRRSVTAWCGASARWWCAAPGTPRPGATSWTSCGARPERGGTGGGADRTVDPPPGRGYRPPGRHPGGAGRGPVPGTGRPQRHGRGQQHRRPS